MSNWRFQFDMCVLRVNVLVNVCLGVMEGYESQWADF